MKKHLWSIAFGIMLVGFTTYIALDTFVLEKKMRENATEMNTSMFDDKDTTSDNDTDEPADNTDTEASSTQQGTQDNASDSKTSDLSYSDDDVKLTITEYYEKETHIYVADITVSSSRYIKTAFANDTYGKNIKAHTSSIAEHNNAIFAINGDYYGVQEKGYVIRNGVVYRKSNDGDDLLCLYADGTMKIVDSDDKTPEELVEDGVWQLWNFGPGLLKDSKIIVGERDEVAQAMASNPRTAIGMIDACHYIVVVSDGRTKESAGLTLYELAQFMQKLGAKTAYNLDGGGSATMYFDGEIINKPTTNGEIKERRVSDIVYIGKQKTN